MAMENLLENNLFLSLLSQGGASIAGPDSVAAGVNPILQQTIAAQSKTKEQQRQMELMSKLFGKGVDMKSDAKGGISINAETIEALSSLLGGEGGASGLGTLKEEGATGLAPDTTQIQPGQGQGLGQGSGIEMLRNLLNPPASSPDVPAYSDLVGLTTKDISEALAGAQKTEVMKQSVAKSAADRRAAAAKAATDTEYKQALTKQAKATTKKTLAGLKEDIKKSPLAVPGLDELTMDQWKSLDTKTKAYSYYAFDAKQSGESVMPYNEWSKQTDDPTAKQIYDVAKVDPNFKEFYFESRRAGAPKVSIGERELEKAGVSGQVYFKSGKFINDLDDYMDSEDVQNRLLASTGDPAKRSLEESRAKVKFIEDNIIARNGNVEDVKFTEDGKTMVWTVTWPSGDTEEVRYAIRP